MTKAFVYVDILLDKLYSRGVRSITHKMIKSYSNDRTQLSDFNRINFTTKSETKYICDSKVTLYRVSQGSV